jgi:hypothetical protein
MLDATKCCVFTVSYTLTIIQSMYNSGYVDIVHGTWYTVWSCRGIQDFGGTEWEYSENVVRLYIWSLLFAAAGSKSHAKIRYLWMIAPPAESMVILFVGVFVIFKINENVMIAAVCNVQCYMLFICVWNLFLIFAYILYILLLTNFCYSPVDTQLNCRKNNYKNWHWNISDMFWCSHTIIRERITRAC